MARRTSSFLVAMLFLVILPLHAAAPRRAVGRPSPTPPPPAYKLPICSPITITAQPTSSPLWIAGGGTSTLSVSVTSSAPVDINWFTSDDTPVGTGASVLVSPASNTCYYAVVSNICEVITLKNAWVMICTPVITENPTVSPATISAGQSATLEAGGGNGQGPMTYKWYTSDGTFLANGKKLLVHPVVTTSYYYKLCNSWESGPSGLVTLTVTSAK